MARRRKLRVNRRGEEELPEFRLKPQTKRGILVVLFFALAVLSLLSLFDSAGSLGRIFGQFLGLLLGTAGFLGPIIFLALAVGLLLNRRESKDGRDVPVSNLRGFLGVLFFSPPRPRRGVVLSGLGGGGGGGGGRLSGTPAGDAAFRPVGFLGVSGDFGRGAPRLNRIVFQFGPGRAPRPAAFGIFPRTRGGAQYPGRKDQQNASTPFYY